TQQARRIVEHEVMDGVRARQKALPALLRHADAEHRDDVAGIGVDVLRAAGVIAAPLARIRLLIAHVPDVAEHISEEALRHGNTEMRSDTPIDHLQIIDAILVRRQAPHDDETAPGCDLLLDRLELATDALERKIIWSDRQDAGAARFHLGEA